MPNAGAVRLGKWLISYDPPPIPVRDLDYVGVHDDFDGAPTYSDGPCTDNRCVRGSSVEDVKEQILELESEDDPEDDNTLMRLCERAEAMDDRL